MRIEQDFVELLKLFNKYQIRYCVIGAFAFGFHARPRYTKDLDILLEPTKENGGKIVDALNEFGFKSLKLTEKDFSQKEKFIQLGYEPVRVDLITSIKGITFDKIWQNKVQGTYGGEKVYFISLDDLIKSKKIAKRKQDMADLEILIDVKQRATIRSKMAH